MIHSLGEFPEAATRGYYIYILDYGWDGPLESVLRDNFSQMGKAASENNAIVFKGTVGGHFEDEVLSWHGVNGQNADKILPAILITTKHPKAFQEECSNRAKHSDDNLILIPLKKCCKTEAEVITLIQEIFSDVKESKKLSSFKISKELRRGAGSALVDAVILEPNVGGIGINLKALFSKIFSKDD